MSNTHNRPSSPAHRVNQQQTGNAVECAMQSGKSIIGFRLCQDHPSVKMNNCGGCGLAGVIAKEYQGKTWGIFRKLLDKIPNQQQ